MRRSAFAIVYF